MTDDSYTHPSSALASLTHLKNLIRRIMGLIYWLIKSTHYHLWGVTAGILTSGLTPLFIRSMCTGPRHWRARGHREIIWSFTKVFFKFPKRFESRLFQFFFLVVWISNGYLWYLWVDSASCMIKRFVVVFIVTDIMCRHSPLHEGFLSCPKAKEIRVWGSIRGK